MPVGDPRRHSICADCYLDRHGRFPRGKLQRSGDERAVRVQRPSEGSVPGSSPLPASGASSGSLAGSTARNAAIASSSGNGMTNRSSRSSGVGWCLVTTSPRYRA